MPKGKVIDGISKARVVYPDGLDYSTHGAALEFQLESGKIATVPCSVSAAPAKPAPVSEPEPAAPKVAATSEESAADEKLPAEETAPASELKGELPDDFPYKKELGEADPPIHTYAQVRKVAKAGTLTEIVGIGEKGEVKILAALGIDETPLE